MTEKRERYIPWWAEDMEKKRREKKAVNVKRGRASKRKGKRGEKEWGEYVVERIGGEFIARGGDRDVQFIGNALASTHNEVKRRKSFSFVAHCRQAWTDSLRHGLQRWLVAFRADCEPGERKQWYVVLDAADYLADMDELRDLRTIVDALKLEERVREEGERCGR